MSAPDAMSDGKGTESMTYQHPYRDLQLGEFSWCLKCETVHRTAAWQQKQWECPRCGAGSPNLWPWERVRQVNPQYPEQPEEGTQYTL